MHIRQQNILLNNLVLKLISLILGYIIWSIVSQTHTTTSHLTIPLFFYNIQQHTNIAAPEIVTIQLQGSKKVLHALSNKQLAAHIDAQTLKAGKNLVHLSKSMLFLPGKVELLDTTPSPVIISLEAS